MSEQELLPVVNDEGQVLHYAPRSECHNGESFLLHPVVHLHLLNEEGDIFLQKRSVNKDVQPGKWDTAVGGHVDPGESIEEALLREALEELGLTGFEYRLVKKYKWHSEVERELVHSFVCNTEVEPVIDRSEIDEGRFWSLEEIESNLGQGVFTPNFEHEYRMFLVYGVD